MYVHSPGQPSPAQPRRHVPAAAHVGGAPGPPGDSGSKAAGVECLDAALWYERSTLEALVAALSGQSGSDVLEPLLRERRMARLLSSIETAALTANLGLLPHASDLGAALGGGWAGVLNEHDAALQRLVDQADAAASPARPLSPVTSLDCSQLDNASAEQAE